MSNKYRKDFSRFMRFLAILAIPVAFLFASCDIFDEDEEVVPVDNAVLVTSVAAGGYHTVALKSDGTVWAWGGGAEAQYNRGQLGDNTVLQRLTPVRVKGPGGVGFLDNVIGISAGEWHTVALKSDNTVWAWGYNLLGGLGNGDTVGTNQPAPVQVKGVGGDGFLDCVVSVSAGEKHTVALKSDGSVYAWGNNDFGQLGDNTTTGARYTPVRVKGPGGSGFLDCVVSVSTSWNHNVAVKMDGSVWAWGDNFYGQLGDNTVDQPVFNSPVRVTGPNGEGYLDGVVSVSAGFYHTVARKSDGSVWAWGRNWNGELGDGNYGNGTDQRAPVQVKGTGGSGFLAEVASVSVGKNHNAATKADGSVWTWGFNYFGQIGDNTTYIAVQQRTTPVQVKGTGGTGFLTGVDSIDAGEEHTVALKADGSVWAWGYNAFGQLGDGHSGANVYHSAPVQVLFP